MLNCKEISKLVSESLDHKLPLWKRMELWMHLNMCRLCSSFRRDLVELRKGTRKHVEEIENGTDATDAALSPAARRRIKRAIDHHDS